MGLDQYLTVSEYVTRTTRDGIRPDAPKANPLFEELRDRRPSWVDKGSFQGISVRYPAGYWRKANGIHNWFVQNVQDGRDECQEAYLSKQDLLDLRQACEQVLAVSHRDEEVIEATAIDAGLATKAGFFFGTTEYDDWYFEDLRYTVKLIYRLETCGALDDPWVDIYYQASW